MNAPANPLAFPRFVPDGHYNGSIDAEGMDLRDYFAGQALAGCLASGKWDNAGTGFEAYIATHAYNIADAMLAAREQATAR